MPIRTRIGLIGLIVTGVTVAVITLWPEPVTDGHIGTIARILEWLHAHGMPERFRYAQLEFVANVVVFIPIGLFTTLLYAPRWRWLAVITPPLASACIEFTQLLLLPARYATVNDVIANTLGGWIGVACAAIGLAWAEARSRGANSPA